MNISSNNVVPLHPKRKFRTSASQNDILDGIFQDLNAFDRFGTIPLSASLDFIKKKIAGEGSPFSLNPFLREAGLPEDKKILGDCVIKTISLLERTSENVKYALLRALETKIERSIKRASQSKYA